MKLLEKTCILENAGLFSVVELKNWPFECFSETLLMGKVGLLGQFLKNLLSFNYQKDAIYQGGIWDPNTTFTTRIIKIWVQDSSNSIRVQL